ncbi:hypothetical protein F5Y10DRAFT_285280 [Nemania abortiva]|nr:hypothetical protein F5Y10DRAFT_285280 [Nemania abortiva]
MDPVSIIGVAGAAVNLAEFIGKTIKLISDTCDRWKDADLYFLSLRTQLGALKSALISIQSWLDANPGSIHYLLEMELDSTNGSLRDVYGEMTVSDLGIRGKAKFLLSGNSMEEVLRMVDRQTSSMTLLLTACNFNTLARQKSFVEAPSTQKALEQTKSDSASLFGLRDADSCCSRATTGFTQTSSKLSMVFDFDRELFSSKVYGLLHRETVKKSIRQRQRAHSLDPGMELSDRAAQHWRAVSVLLLGDTRQCDEFYASMASEYGQPLNLHAVQAEIDVPSLLLQSLRRVLEQAGDVGVLLLSRTQQSAEQDSYSSVMGRIKRYLLCLDTMSDARGILSHSADVYLEHERVVADMRTVASGAELSLPRLLAYDARSIRSYRFRRKRRSGGFAYHFTAAARLTAPMASWLDSGPVRVLLYVVDLGLYDRRSEFAISSPSSSSSSLTLSTAPLPPPGLGPPLDDGSAKSLVDDIADFAALAVQKGQVKMVLLTNLAALADKLDASPFCRTYPDYRGDNSPDDVVGYIKARFAAALWEKEYTYIHVVADPVAFSHAQWFDTCAKDAIMRFALWRIGRV